MKMRIVDPGSVPRFDFHQFIVGSIAPRPIAFVSTIDKEGNTNLAPYSFFNAFSSNPPILVFSSNRRVSDNTTKDTLSNVLETKEVVINAVNYKIVHQMAVASVEFPKGVDEFKKSGLTPIPSDFVKPFRVKESPIQIECKVKEVITLGTEGGAGHLVICEVLRMHISEEIIDEKGRIDPHKADLMGRLGRSYYVRASGDAIYTIPQAVEKLVIGFDNLPEGIRKSTVFTGNNLGQLAGIEAAPEKEEVMALKNGKDPRIAKALEDADPKMALHRYAKELLDANVEDRDYAAKVAWLAEYL